MQRLDHVRSPIRCLAFAPDGKMLAASSRRHCSLALWELPGGDFRRWNPQIPGPITSFAFSPDGSWLAVGGEVGLVLPYELSAWDYDTEFHAGGPFGGMFPVFALAYCPRSGSPILAAASMGMTLYRIKGKNITMPLRGRCELTAATWDADGKRLATINADTGRVYVWDFGDQLRAKMPDHVLDDMPQPPTAITFAPDGKTLAVVGDGIVSLYNLARKAIPAPTLLPGRRRSVTQLAYHPSGTFLASAGTDGTVRFWDVQTDRQRECFDWQIGKVRALAFDTEGLRCAAAGDTGKIVIWDVET